jgi:hypothetical protein
MEAHVGTKPRLQTLLILCLLVLAPLEGCKNQNTVTGQASQVTISAISPDHGCPGDELRIRGTQLLKVSLAITQNGTTVGTGQTPYRTSTEIRLVLPDLPPGSYDVVANGDPATAKSFTEDDCRSYYPYAHPSSRR